MYVLDSVRRLKDWRITVPLYHRGHLSLMPGTTVHLAWVFRDANQTVNSSLLPEIFGTTVRQDAWPNVYRVSIALYDAPGVLHRVLQSISRHGGNVLQLDSTSTERELHHNAEMIIDFASLGHESRPGRDHSREIEGLLLADCAAHIVMSDAENDFRLRVKQISSFRRMDDIVTNTRSSGKLRTVSEHHIADDGSIVLDENFRTLLTNSGLTEPIYYLVTSDTKDRVFRITFFPKTQPVVWCTIRHADKEGAIEAITAALSAHNITLLCTLNRVQEHLGHNWFETVATSAKWRIAPDEVSTKSPSETISEILDAVALKPFRLSWFFERRQARDAMRENLDILSFREAVYLKRGDRDLNRWLDEKDAELITLKASNHNRLLTKKEKHHERALCMGIDRVRSATGRQIHKVFLSIEFTKRNKTKIDIVEAACKRAGFVADVVQNPNDEPVIWREVVDRIQRATDVIAVWTPSQKSETHRVSPWCLWELGVANAFGKNCYVMLQDGTNALDYRIIHGAEYYYRFSGEDEFSREIEAVMHQISVRANAHGMHRRWRMSEDEEETRRGYE